jgi:hypothetical protein
MYAYAVTVCMHMRSLYVCMCGDRPYVNVFVFLYPYQRLHMHTYVCMHMLSLHTWPSIQDVHNYIHIHSHTCIHTKYIHIYILKLFVYTRISGFEWDQFIAGKGNPSSCMMDPSSCIYACMYACIYLYSYICTPTRHIRMHITYINICFYILTYYICTYIYII